MGIALSGVPLALKTCARRLAPSDAGFGAGADPDVQCDISWFGPAPVAAGRPGSEATIQALSGLMAVHGLDAGRPRRVGLEIASVAAGMLAAQGVMAALVGHRRGHAVEPVRTSVLQAAVLLMSHYVAAATAGGEPVPTAPGPEPGPPFRTADERWFEIEVFDAEGWKRFWLDLGAEGVDLGRAWTSFRGRYYRGDCSFPPGLHAVAGRHPLAEVEATAEVCGVSLCPVRDYAEVRLEPGWSAGHPILTAAPPGSGVRNDAMIAPFRTPEPRGQGPSGPSERESRGPLAGLRVVEATNRMQGPLAGLLLQMLGAEVVKVEPPGGDPGRLVPPYAGDTGSFFTCFNRGKTSVELDLTRPAGRAGLLDLLEGADGFLHNWRPGKAAEWGLEAAEVTARHRRLVYTTASGWGDLPHNRRLIGTDFLVQAYAGAGYGVEPSALPPRPTRVLVTDFMGALVTCEGVLAGLLARERTGAGVTVETSLLQGAMALQAHVFEGMEAGQEEGRQAGRPVWGPLDTPVDTADGTLVVTADDDDRLRRLCEVCEVSAGAASRREVEVMAVERLRLGSAPAWDKLLTEAGVPSAVAGVDLSALAADPVLQGLYEPLGGAARAPRAPWERGA
jgi:crotonobetainyl-CoA:carnitine CoA-transferase CaiB-like acyl-CoA transferase